MAIVWKGVFPALTTKFTAKDELDLPLFEKNLKFQLASGVDGIILGGSLGEASVLTTEEKERLVKFEVQSVAGQEPIINKDAEGSTRDDVGQLVYAKEGLAGGIMSAQPTEYSAHHRELVNEFKT